MCPIEPMGDINMSGFCTWKGDNSSQQNLEGNRSVKQYRKYYRMRDIDIKLYKQVDENLTFFKLRCASTGSL